MNGPVLARAHFRNDINGLRAWAVLAVVLYHFGIPGFGGGFVGVDVFFVISGFLMTGIVIAALEKGSFSILGFYMARARRIVPALLVLCAVLLAMGWVVMPPADYQAFAAQATASVAFLSNVYFWRESGYFDASSHEKWLLHTWSLAVEWQFYLILPLALTALWAVRPGRRPALAAIVVGIAASLALSAALTPDKPTGSFFLLPTRAWEMLAGGLVYLLSGRWNGTPLQRQWLEYSGLAMVAIGIAALDASVAWPGWAAVWPVLGAMLVLLAARERSALTGNRVAQWVGTRSYSIYLWHWPLAVTLRYMGVFHQPAAIAIGLLGACVLGDVSYRLVEARSRDYLSAVRMARAFATLAVCTVVVGAASQLVVFQQGFAGRLDPGIEMVSQQQFNINPRRSACHISAGTRSPSCMYGGADLGVVLIGDSHANALVTALADALPPPYGVMEWSFSACPFLPGARRANLNLKNTCADFVDWALQTLPTLPPEVSVVVVNRHGQYALGQNEDPAQANMPWVNFSKPYARSETAFLVEYGQHLKDVACSLARSRKVYLVRPIPEMGVHVPNTARAMVWGFRREVMLSLRDYHARNDFIWAAQDAAHDQCGVEILDPLPYLCKDGICRGARDGRPLYSDDNHLSEFGNQLLVPMFAKVGRDLRLAR